MPRRSLCCKDGGVRLNRAEDFLLAAQLPLSGDQPNTPEAAAMVAKMVMMPVATIVVVKMVG